MLVDFDNIRVSSLDTSLGDYLDRLSATPGAIIDDNIKDRPCHTYLITSPSVHC